MASIASANLGGFISAAGALAPSSSSNPYNIWVRGATGNVGREVVRQLLAASPSIAIPAGYDEIKAIAAVHNVKKAVESLSTLPYLQYLYMDVEKLQTFAAAARERQPTTCFLMRPPELTDVEGIFLPLHHTLAEAGMQHVTFLSLMGASSNSFVPRRKIEACIKALPSVPWTMLEASFCMQNLTGIIARDVIEYDQIYVPAGVGRTSFIDIRDIAAVAVQTLTVPAQPAGKAYTLTGSEALTYEDVTRLISAAVGREITYANPLSLSFAWHMRRNGHPWAFIGVMIGIYAACWLGPAARNTHDVDQWLERSPIRMEQFVQENASAWHQHLLTVDGRESSKVSSKSFRGAYGRQNPDDEL